MTFTAERTFVSIAIISYTEAKPPLPRSRPLEYRLKDASPVDFTIFSSIIWMSSCRDIGIYNLLLDYYIYIKDICENNLQSSNEV